MHEGCPAACELLLSPLLLLLLSAAAEGGEWTLVHAQRRKKKQHKKKGSEQVLLERLPYWLPELEEKKQKSRSPPSVIILNPSWLS